MRVVSQAAERPPGFRGLHPHPKGSRVPTRSPHGRRARCRQGGGPSRQLRLNSIFDKSAPNFSPGASETKTTTRASAPRGDCWKAHSIFNKSPAQIFACLPSENGQKKTGSAKIWSPNFRQRLIERLIEYRVAFFSNKSPGRKFGSRLIEYRVQPY